MLDGISWGHRRSWSESEILNNEIMEEVVFGNNKVYGIATDLIATVGWKEQSLEKR